MHTGHITGLFSFVKDAEVNAELKPSTVSLQQVIESQDFILKPSVSAWLLYKVETLLWFGI